MGSAYEFSNTDLEDETAINRGLLTSYRRKIMYSDKYKQIKRGTITDDSILTIELLSSLYFNETKEQRLRRYYDTIKSGGEFAKQTSGTFGKNTRSLFKNLRYKENYFKQFGVNVGELAINNPESNGCLMRCSPFAIQLSNYDLMYQIEKEIMITNPTINCIDICIAYIYLLRCGLSNKDPIKSINTLYDFTVNEKILEVLDICLNGQEYPPTKDKNKKGWVFVAFYYSIVALLKYANGIHFNRIIPWIVLQGGDTDTNAAIAGGLIGSFIGYNELENDEITRQNIDDITEERENIKYRNVRLRDWNIIIDRAEALIDA